MPGVSRTGERMRAGYTRCIGGESPTIGPMQADPHGAPTSALASLSSAERGTSMLNHTAAGERMLALDARRAVVLP